MTQITKTLSIAGIIALVTAPAMADIASTAYVQNIVNNMIPQSGTVGHVLKKTATGLEWAAAPTPTLETTTGYSETTTMTQKAITEALNGAVGDGWNITIGDNASGDSGGGDGTVSIGVNTVAGEGSVVIGYEASADSFASVVIGGGAKVANDEYGYAASDAIAIGYNAFSGNDAIAIGYYASSGGTGSIQLGRGTNNTAHSFSVGLGYYDADYNPISHTLLDANAVIPAGRLTAPNFVQGKYVSDNNGVSGQLLQTNGDGTMSWVDAPSAPTLASILPTAPNNCKNSDGQQCALVMTWSSSQNKFTYSWEVVKVNQ